RLHRHRRPAQPEEDQAAAQSLGHAAGAAVHRRPRAGARRAARPDQGRTRAGGRGRSERDPGEAAQERLEFPGTPGPGKPAYRGFLLPGHRRAIPHSATRQNASATIALLILLVPRSRSTKVIGTSVTVIPARMVRRARSIWKQ